MVTWALVLNSRLPSVERLTSLYPDIIPRILASWGLDCPYQCTTRASGFIALLFSLDQSVSAKGTLVLLEKTNPSESTTILGILLNISLISPGGRSSWSKLGQELSGEVPFSGKSRYFLAWPKAAAPPKTTGNFKKPLLDNGVFSMSLSFLSILKDRRMSLIIQFKKHYWSREYPFEGILCPLTPLLQIGTTLFPN